MINYSGIIIDKNDKYTIYSCISSYEHGINEYYLYIPNTNSSEYSLYINFSNIEETDYRNSILRDTFKIINKLDSKNIIYVFTVLPNRLLIDNNIFDDKLYTEIAKSLVTISSDIFDYMINDEHKQMEQYVYLVTKDEFDIKFSDWLNSYYSINHPNLAKIFKTFNLPEEKHIIGKDEQKELLYENNESTGNSGNSFSGGSSSYSQEQNKPKVKILVPPNKHGFSNICFLSLVILLSLTVGISIAYLLIK